MQSILSYSIRHLTIPKGWAERISDLIDYCWEDGLSYPG